MIETQVRKSYKKAVLKKIMSIEIFLDPEASENMSISLVCRLGLADTF